MIASLHARSSAPAPTTSCADEPVQRSDAAESRALRGADFERRLEEASEASELAEEVQAGEEAQAPTVAQEAESPQGGEDRPQDSPQRQARPAAEAPKADLAPHLATPSQLPEAIQLALAAGPAPTASVPSAANSVAQAPGQSAPLATVPPSLPAQPTPADAAREQTEVPAPKLANLKEALAAAPAAGARETSAPAHPTAAVQESASRLEAPARAEAPTVPTPAAETLSPRAAEVLRQMRLQLSPQLRQATLQLEPEALGRIELRVRVHNGKASADLRVESEATLAVLQRHVPELRAVLEASGLGGGDVSLSWQEPRQQDERAPRDVHNQPARAAGRVAAPPRVAELARLAADASGVDTYA